MGLPEPALHRCHRRACALGVRQWGDGGECRESTRHPGISPCPVATPLHSREGAVSSSRARVPARLARAAVGGAAGSGAAREPGTRRDPSGERARRGDAALLLRSLLPAERRRRVSWGYQRPRPAFSAGPRPFAGRPAAATRQPRGKQAAAGRGGCRGPWQRPADVGAVPIAASLRRPGGSGCSFLVSPPPRPVPVGTGLVGCPPRPLRSALPRACRRPERSEHCRLHRHRHGLGRAGLPGEVCGCERGRAGVIQRYCRKPSVKSPPGSQPPCSDYARGWAFSEFLLLSVPFVNGL